ncbi:hpcH/HpaI aldolase/citrate lyase family protein [Mycobacterium xenopi 3993]|nr:hpcH/HpaI aldolase/citrate lyase family protein [Mycobacterium xenopi 3993]
MNDAYRPRRTCLSVPGSSQKMIDKAKGLPADEVFLDLEDAVAPAAKSSARARVAAALGEPGWPDNCAGFGSTTGPPRGRTPTSSRWSRPSAPHQGPSST